GDPPESYSTVHQYGVGHRKGAAANEEEDRADQPSAMPFWMRSMTEESASVVTSPTSRFSATSLSRRRMILPDRVFGRSGTSRTDLGVAIGTIELSTWPRRSSTTTYPTSEANSRMIMKDSMVWPVVT